MPDFTPKAMAEAQAFTPPRGPFGAGVQDLRDLLWCSIDNDDSRDLDQLTVAIEAPGGVTRVLVAVADVSAAVTVGSELDQHAQANTTSVYTVPQIFPMLPEHLSTDLTSLNEGGTAWPL
jgi:exoribonuclease-2